jgi:hypothetical protein
MGNNSTTFTWGSATGANVNPFSITDTANNSGLGSLVSVNTAAGSSLFPLIVTASGTANGVRVSTSGVLAAIGTGNINATQLQGTSVSSTAPSGNQCLVYNGTAWAPGSCGGGANATQLQGTNVSSTAPTTNQALVYDGANWSPSSAAEIRVFNTPSGSTHAAIASTTMLTTGAADGNYRFSFYITQIDAGTSCTAVTSVSTKLSFTDPVSGVAQPENITMFNIFSSGATSGSGIQLATSSLGIVNTGNGTFFFRAKASSTIQYSVGYAQGSGCSPGPNYEVFPVLEQVF